MADGSTATSGIALPPKNVELREREEAVLHGDDLALTITVPHSNSPPMHVQVKGSTEVGYVKLLLADKIGVDAGKLRLSYRQPRDDTGEEKLVTLIDPMSLCDFKVNLWATMKQRTEFCQPAAYHINVCVPPPQAADAVRLFQRRYSDCTVLHKLH